MYAQKCAHTKKNNHINPSISPYKPVCAKNHADFRLQIGELAGKLTEEFRVEYSQMPWRDIVSIRNRAAHNYGSMDANILWDIATKDIPTLKKYCESIITQITKE